jgi:hypothetical protein
VLVEDPLDVSRDSLAWGKLSSFEPRSEELKCYDGEVELVAVDWRSPLISNRRAVFRP